MPASVIFGGTLGISSLSVLQFPCLNMTVFSAQPEDVLILELREACGLDILRVYLRKGMGACRSRGAEQLRSSLNRTYCEGVLLTIVDSQPPVAVPSDTSPIFCKTYMEAMFSS